jgi:hypothetical protein
VVEEPAAIEVIGFLWEFGPDQNVSHLAKHDVAPDDVYAVLRNLPIFFYNSPGRTATHAMVGVDERGRVLQIAILPTHEPGVWKPITGWESRKARSAYYGER